MLNASTTFLYLLCPTKAGGGGETLINPHNSVAVFKNTEARLACSQQLVQSKVCTVKTVTFRLPNSENCLGWRTRYI